MTRLAATALSSCLLAFLPLAAGCPDGTATGDGDGDPDGGGDGDGDGDESDPDQYQGSVTLTLSDPDTGDLLCEVSFDMTEPAHQGLIAYFGEGDAAQVGLQLITVLDGYTGPVVNLIGPVDLERSTHELPSGAGFSLSVAEVTDNSLQVFCGEAQDGEVDEESSFGGAVPGGNLGRYDLTVSDYDGDGFEPALDAFCDPYHESGCEVALGSVSVTGTIEGTAILDDGPANLVLELDITELQAVISRGD